MTLCDIIQFTLLLYKSVDDSNKELQLICLVCCCRLHAKLLHASTKLKGEVV